MTGIRDRFIALLRSQVGYHEGRDASGWDNIQKYSEQTPGLQWSDGQAWCAVFEAWGASKTGFSSDWPMTASCGTAVSWWKERGRFTGYPVLGGPLYMGAGGGEHTEVVFKYDADHVWSVGGNTNSNGSATGDGVYEHVRPRRGADSPYGYGVPAFPEGTISADPRLGGVAAASAGAVPVSSGSVSSGGKTVQCVPFPGAGWFTMGRRSPIVAAMHERLVAEGCDHYKSSADADVIGSGDVASYEAWQRKCGFTGSAATWPPGETTWNRLRVPKTN